jgi:hypothetical protein
VLHREKYFINNLPMQTSWQKCFFERSKIKYFCFFADVMIVLFSFRLIRSICASTFYNSQPQQNKKTMTCGFLFLAAKLKVAPSNISIISELHLVSNKPTNMFLRLEKDLWLEVNKCMKESFM